ncbi:MAG: hypothetical protein ACM3QW_01080 [Ignavibacteriales bacterium]
MKEQKIDPAAAMVIADLLFGLTINILTNSNKAVKSSVPYTLITTAVSPHPQNQGIRPAKNQEACGS